MLRDSRYHLVAVALVAAAPAAQAATTRSLAWLQAPCADVRFPTLAGEWAVGCGPSGRVDRAVHVESGETLSLQGLSRSPGVGPGVLWEPGHAGGVWRLPELTPQRMDGWVDLDLVAPPGTDGAKVVLSTDKDLQWMEMEGNRRFHIESQPAPWYPPAVAGDVIAWVCRTQETGEDIWIMEGGKVRPLANGPGHERHPKASGEVVAWLEEEGVVLHHLDTGKQTRFPGDVHTNTGLTVWGSVACWEAWEDGDIDIRCSDGTRIGGEGHQRHPARHGNALLYRENGHTWVVLLDVSNEAPLDGD